MEDYIFFESREQFRKWLEINVVKEKNIWIIFKKNLGLKASEALEEALCFGWIDGIMKNIDENSYIKRFSERTKKSKWSEKNKEMVDILEEKGLMHEFGLAKVTEAVMNGIWDNVEDEETTEQDIKIFVESIRINKTAYENLLNMSPSVQKTYAKHYYTAKTDGTKEKRFRQIIERLEKNKKPM